jgi:hypothetical protein
LIVQTRAPTNDVAPGDDTSAAPPYALYPRRAHTPRGRNVQRSPRCAGVLLCVTFTAVWGVPSGEATLVGALTAACHWPPGQPHVAEHCRPHRVCTGHRADITNSQPTFRDYINKSRSFLAHANRRPSSVVRHRCHLGELPALCIHDTSVLRLAPLLTHLEPTCAPVALAEPPVHRSTSSSGRRRVASGEPHSPLELPANKPL